MQYSVVRKSYTILKWYEGLWEIEVEKSNDPWSSEAVKLGIRIKLADRIYKNVAGLRSISENR